MSKITDSKVARELISANRSRKRKVAPAETVEEWLAQGGKIERLPEGASGEKHFRLRFDHSQGRAI